MKNWKTTSFVAVLCLVALFSSQQLVRADEHEEKGVCTIRGE